jgi:hypothetical protein
MKKIDVGQVISILANIGVIAGIVFLVVEIQQNTAAIRSQSSIAINDSLAHLNQALYDNPDLTDIWIRGRESLDDLDPNEAERFSAYLLERLNLAVYVRELERGDSEDVHIDWIDIVRREILEHPGICDFVSSGTLEPTDFWAPMIDDCAARQP